MVTKSTLDLQLSVLIFKYIGKTVLSACAYREVNFEE